MANDRIFLSNDAVGGGIDYNEATFYFGFANESSAAGAAGKGLQAGVKVRYQAR